MLDPLYWYLGMEPVADRKMENMLKVPKHEIFGFGVISSKKPQVMDLGNSKKKICLIISCYSLGFMAQKVHMRMISILL